MTMQGTEKVIFTACHLGKLKLAFTSPNILPNFLMGRVDFTVLLQKTSLACRES